MTYWDYPHIGTLTFLLFRWDLGARVYLRGRTLCAAVSCRPCPSVATGFGHVIRVTCIISDLLVMCLVVCKRILSLRRTLYVSVGTQRKNVCSRARALVRRYRSDQIKPITGMIVADERWLNEWEKCRSFSRPVSQ